MVSIQGRHHKLLQLQKNSRVYLTIHPAVLAAFCSCTTLSKYSEILVLLPCFFSWLVKFLSSRQLQKPQLSEWYQNSDLCKTRKKKLRRRNYKQKREIFTILVVILQSNISRSVFVWLTPPLQTLQLKIKIKIKN